MMSSSWNFPSWADPNWKVSKLSIFYILLFILKLLFILVLPISELKISYFDKKMYYSLQRKLKIEWTKYQVFWKSRGNEEKNASVKKCHIFDFQAEINFLSWTEKVTSRVELKTLQLKLWLEPAWLGLITSI